MTLDQLKGRSSLLQHLSPAGFEFLKSVAETVSYASEAVIFKEEAPAVTFYLVSEGKVGLEVMTPTGPSGLIESLGPGELLGVSWLFAPYRWNYQARALTPVTLIAFDSETVRRKLETDRELALDFYQTVGQVAARRLQATRLRLLDLYREVDR